MIHRKNLIKLIEQNSYRYDRWRVFSDFVEMAALSISNSVDLAQYELREARYLQIINGYDKEEAARFPQMLGELVNELEAGPADVLGAVFMEMELGNKHTGQFFTPYCISQMMARTLVDDDMREKIARSGFVTAHEPACGGGAMIIALAEAMQQAGINYQEHLHVTAQDLDVKAVHMAYVQLSLLHIPAVMIQGNTLALEEISKWYTPAHVMGGWSFKLNRKESEQPVPDDEPKGQMNLFEEIAQ